MVNINIGNIPIILTNSILLFFNLTPSIESDIKNNIKIRINNKLNIK